MTTQTLADRRLPLSDGAFFLLALAIWFAVPVLGLVLLAA